MIRLFASTALLLVIGPRAVADINLLVDFYDVGTTTPVVQPITVGETFDMAISVQDTVGAGVSSAILDWFFDSALLAQGDFQVATGWNNIGGSGTNATGGTIEVFTFSAPAPPDAIVEMARVGYTATAPGNAMFSTAGTGNPMATTFATFDNRGFFPDGTCNPATPCAGEMVQFGTGTIEIEGTVEPDGDFTGPEGTPDGVWDCLDIDALVDAIVNGGDLSFDMNGDGELTPEDITDPGLGWLAVGGSQNVPLTGGNPFLEGDATLDGVVDGQDFFRWNESKFTSVPAWCSGDFTADGVVDGQDFFRWNENKFTSSGGAIVPEPSGVVLLLLGVVTWIVRRR